VLLAEDSGDVVGLAELSIRPYAERCRTSPVVYLEGWYVAPQARRRGIGRALIHAAERWGREQGCDEFASDAQPDNATSLLAHRAVGFEDAGMVQCFRKGL
jgi:aminoglycoside 6'-N-acetyltransferase I